VKEESGFIRVLRKKLTGKKRKCFNKYYGPILGEKYG